MKNSSTTDRFRKAVDQVNETAKKVRKSATQLVGRAGDEEKGANGKAEQMAAALSRLSDSLERAGENAMASGLAVRDRSRDTARAVSRSERILREQGLRGATARVVAHPRRGLIFGIMGAVVAALGVLITLGVRRGN